MKQVSSATAPTATLLRPRPLVAELASDVELAEEELSLALSAADEDAELLLAVALVEELEPEDCEAVDEAVSESVWEASEVLLAVAEPLPVVEAGVATVAFPMSCTKVKALDPNVDCQQARYEAPPSAPAVVASTAVLQVRPGSTSHGTALPEAAKSVLDEHAV